MGTSFEQQLEVLKRIIEENNIPVKIEEYDDSVLIKHKNSCFDAYLYKDSAISVINYISGIILGINIGKNNQMNREKFLDYLKEFEKETSKSPELDLATELIRDLIEEIKNGIY